MPCVATDLHRDYIFIPKTEESFNAYLRAYPSIRALEQEFAGPDSKGFLNYDTLARECGMVFGQRPFIAKSTHPEPLKLIKAVLQLVKVERKQLSLDHDDRKVLISWTDKWMLTQQSKSLSAEGFVFVKNDFGLWPEYLLSFPNGSTAYIFGDIKEFEEDAMMAILKTEVDL